MDLIEIIFSTDIAIAWFCGIIGIIKTEFYFRSYKKKLTVKKFV